MAGRPNSLLTDKLTSLTEFGVITPENAPEPSGFSLSRLFRKIKPDVNLESVNEITRSNSGTDSIEQNYEEKNAALPSEVEMTPDMDPQVAFSGRDAVYTRSLTNVLKRVRNILDRRSSTPQAYKDSDFKQYWMPDSNCKECYECGDKFNTFRRRHHCRVCGQIFCRRCCNQEIPGKIMGYTGDLRACTYCCKVVLSYIQSSDLLPSGDLKALQEDLNTCLSDMDSQLESSNSIYESANHSIRSSGSFRRKISTGFREEEFVRTSSRSDLRTFPSLPDMQSLSERKLLTKDSIQLHELWTQMGHPVHGMDFQTHRHLLKTFQNCVLGSEVVDWLLSKDKVSSRFQAVAIGQALMDAGILEVIGRTNNVFIDDFILYQACKKEKDKHKKLTDLCDAEHEPLWVKEIIPDEEITEDDSDGSQEVVNLGDDFSTKDEGTDSIPRSYSTFYLDLNLKNSTASVKKAIPPVEFKLAPNKTVKVNPVSSSDCFNSEHLRSILPQSDASSTTISDDFLRDALFVNRKGTRFKENYVAPQGWNPTQNLREENGERLAFDRLQGAYEIHRQALIRQLLSTENLSLCWCDTIISIVKKVVEMVRPDIMNDGDDKNVRQYVHVKTIPGGNKSECKIVSGVVCTKNIAHRKMKTYLENPNILLVSSSIVYQRIENKFSSLEPIIMQEYEYLKNAVAKICSYKPDIIMVEKTVSRSAQDMLLGLGITVILNVKRSVIERVARCTQADIVSSLDAQLGTPHLGVCHRFWIQNYTMSKGRMKTLMGFDGCPNHLGCTVLLRGASDSELSKVKQITQFLVYVEYNWRLERSFLMDEYAMPPALPDEMSLDLSDNEKVNSENVLFKEGSSRNTNDEDIFVTKNKVTFKSASSKKQQADNTEKQNEKRLKKSESHDDSALKISERLSLEEHVDPLRSSQSLEPKFKSRRKSRLEVAPLPLSNRFRKALNDVVLSCSPNMKFFVPFLESEAGRSCELRNFFPKEIYWSSQLHKDSSSHPNKLMAESDISNMNFATKYSKYLPDNVEIQHLHPFIFAKLTSSVEDSSVQGLLASFRAYGGQIKRLCPHEIANKKREKIIKKEDFNTLKSNVSTSASQNVNVSWEKKVDALDPYKHQRLPVLFCSYSYISNNAPNFCVNPWVVVMDFYGHNDITLGEFLERYCFRSTYECPSESCDTPMTEHIRKFAHEDGCIHIVLKRLEEPIPMADSVILMWSWCYKCKQVTPFTNMSVDTWSLSFAKYLDLRFHGNMYNRRAFSGSCSHALHHDFYQYFGYKDTVASFKFSKISLLEVAIPSIVVKIQDHVFEPSVIINEVKNLTIKGYSIYSCILEKLCTLRESCSGSSNEYKIQIMLSMLSEERNSLRERIGEIQIKLTSPSIDEQSIISEESNHTLRDPADVWCEINDLTCYLKQMVAEAVVSWNSRIQEFISMKRKEEKALRRQALLSVSSQGSLSNFETSTPVPSPDIIFSTVTTQPLNSFSLNTSQDNDSEINIQAENESHCSAVDDNSSSMSVFTASLSKDSCNLTNENLPDESHSEAISTEGVDEIDGYISRDTQHFNSVSDEVCADDSLQNVDGNNVSKQETSNPILATSSPKLSSKKNHLTDEDATEKSRKSWGENIGKSELIRKLQSVNSSVCNTADNLENSDEAGTSSGNKSRELRKKQVNDCHLSSISNDVGPSTSDIVVDEMLAIQQRRETGANATQTVDNPNCTGESNENVITVVVTDLEDEQPRPSNDDGNQCTDANLDLVETSEECRKTIEALDRLQEEEARRRLSSAEVQNCQNSTNSSIASITICETAGMYIGAVQSGLESNESFTIVHRSQVKELEAKDKEAFSKETRSHNRSKSDGDKSLSSQLSSSTNSETDGESIKIPQSSTTPVIKLPTAQSSDKERKVGGTMKNLISQFLSSPVSSPVQSPFPLTEHFLLHNPGIRDDQLEQNIPIIVYDEEPSSVIAYTLASKEYEQLLQDLVVDLISAQQKDVNNASPKNKRRNNSNEELIRSESPVSSFEHNHSPSKKSGILTFVRNQAERGKMLRPVSNDQYEYIQYHSLKRDSAEFDEDQMMDVNSLTNSQEGDKNKSKIPNHHIEIQFSDSSANFYCKVYFAEQFRMLRKLIFPSGEDRYIRSLARCHQWKAHGGKSGSIFCKTHDDRFILKQMSKLEVQSFVVSASHYFKYIHRAANEQRPTVLAKILGVYHIVYKNTQTNTASKLHLLVMENLFYGRKIKRKFDLKGSERNRLVNTAGKEESELVLLDENLLKMTCDCPLYIKPHTKTVLTMAIQNDSEFLSSLLVMDYSLLVGLDEEKKELVVGIIDYIRTFTWDKKLEMVVKAFGNQGKMPTVVSPELYHTRFCEAMDRYFLIVPDRWHGFGKGVNG